MHCTISYMFSTLHPRKPIRIEATVSGGDLSYVLECHGRFKNQREASYVGRDIAARYDSYTEKWGRIAVSDEPPEIVTID